MQQIDTTKEPSHSPIKSTWNRKLIKSIFKGQLIAWGSIILLTLIGIALVSFPYVFMILAAGSFIVWWGCLMGEDIYRDRW